MRVRPHPDARTRFSNGCDCLKDACAVSSGSHRNNGDVAALPRAHSRGAWGELCAVSIARARPRAIPSTPRNHHSFSASPSNRFGRGETYGWQAGAPNGEALARLLGCALEFVAAGSTDAATVASASPTSAIRAIWADRPSLRRSTNWHQALHLCSPPGRTWGTAIRPNLEDSTPIS